MPARTKGMGQRLEEKSLHEPNSGCLLWIGPVRGGYGVISMTRGNRKLKVFAHRASYEHARGPIPTGLVIDHLCRTRCCVNPWHLEPVTSVENVMRYHRSRTHCVNGHPYTAPASDKHERCLVCKKASRARQKRKHRC